MDKGKRAQEPFNEATVTQVSGKYTIPFTGSREELVLINDGTSDLIFTAGAMKSFTLKPGEVFDEELNPFSSVEVVTTGSFRGFVREDK